MANSQFIASIHRDYLAFVAIATDEELGRFVRAQICRENGEELPVLTGMAKALFDTHVALMERLEESSRKKSEAGRRGGNPLFKQKEASLNQSLSNAKPVLKQSSALANQCLSSDKALIKPVSISDTMSNILDTPLTPPRGEPGKRPGPRARSSLRISSRFFLANRTFPRAC